jgi:hypothetical protein
MLSARMPLKSAITCSIRAHPGTECNNLSCPVAGEITIRQPQVTRNRGFFAIESPDGSLTYYVIEDPDGIWQIPPSGGENGAGLSEFRKLLFWFGRFVMSGRTYEVIEVEDRWYSPHATSFRVQASDGSRYVLCHDEVKDVWSLEAFRASG